MHEYIVSAIVLAVKPHRGNDRIAELYTKELGRVEARLVGGRKTLSKFAQHLNPWDAVTVRLVKKQAFTVTDALSEAWCAPGNGTKQGGKRNGSIRKNGKYFFANLEVLFAVRTLTPLLESDPQLWHLLRRMRDGEMPSRKGNGCAAVLKILGYDPMCAECARCSKKPVGAFAFVDQEFVCVPCATKYGRNELLSIA